MSDNYQHQPKSILRLCDISPDDRKLSAVYLIDLLFPKPRDGDKHCYIISNFRLVSFYIRPSPLVPRSNTSSSTTKDYSPTKFGRL